MCTEFQSELAVAYNAHNNGKDNEYPSYYSYNNFDDSGHQYNHGYKYGIQSKQDILASNEATAVRANSKKNYTTNDYTCRKR